jgi:hypothetical protein
MVRHPNVNVRMLSVYYFNMLYLNSAFVRLIQVLNVLELLIGDAYLVGDWVNMSGPKRDQIMFPIIEPHQYVFVVCPTHPPVLHILCLTHVKVDCSVLQHLM